MGDNMKVISTPSVCCADDLFSNLRKNVSTVYQVPDDFTTATVLAVTATAIQHRFVVHPKASWFEPTNLYVALIAPSGSGKSQIVNPLSAVLEDFTEDYNRIHHAAVTERAAERSFVERQRQSAEKNGKRKEAIAFARELDTLPPIHDLQVVTNDITPESLATMLFQQHGRTANISAEPGVFSVIEQYEKKAKPEILLAPFSGDNITVNRQNRVEHIRKPSLTILCGIQPKLAFEYFNKASYANNGLIARFLPFYPASLIGKKIFTVDSPCIDKDLMHQYEERIKTLLRLNYCAEDDKQILLTLDDEAKKTFVAIQEEFDKASVPGEKYAHVDDAASKAAGITLRVAACLHCFNTYAVGNADTVIPEQTLLQAFEVVSSCLAVSARLRKKGKSADIATAEFGTDENASSDKQTVRTAMWISGICSKGKADGRYGSIVLTMRELSRKASKDSKTLLRLLAWWQEHGFVYIPEDDKSKFFINRYAFEEKTEEYFADIVLNSRYWSNRQDRVVDAKEE